MHVAVPRNPRIEAFGPEPVVVARSQEDADWCSVVEHRAYELLSVWRNSIVLKEIATAEDGVGANVHRKFDDIP